MSVVQLPVGALGYDYSFDHPSPAEVVALGRTFVVRYLTGGGGKALTPAEVASLHAVGLSIVPCHEASEKSAAGGFAVGIQHGNAAKAACSALGVPAQCPIPFAVDWDVTAAAMNGPVGEYLRGVKSVLSPARTGEYGGFRAIDLGPAGLGCYWQTYAWSGRRVHSRTHLYQYSNNQQVAHGTVDYNRVVKPFPAWGGGLTVPAFPGTVRRGSEGIIVSRVQARLVFRGWVLDTDGLFGPWTEQVVRKFQAEKGLVVDGIVGPVTWTALWTSPIT